MHQLPEGTREFTVPTPLGALGAVELAPAAAPLRGTAVLVPGFTGSKDDFIPLLAPLAASGYRVVAYSQLGQYGSEGPEDFDAYTLDTYAAGVLAVAEAAGRGAPVHLMGHSLGGLTGRDGVLAAPERFLSYTLLCSGPTGTPAEGWLESSLKAATAGGSLGLWRAGNPDVDPDSLEGQDAWHYRRSLGATPGSVIGGIRILTGAADRTAELAATGLPMLVARGADDNVWPHAVQADMATRLGARHEIIPDAGHCPNEEQPKATAALLTGFWDSVITGRP